MLTDANGFYQIMVSSDPQLADGDWPVVSVSWPTGKWPTGPWWKNTEQIGGSNALDFGLRDNHQSLPFTFVHATDPHVWQGGTDKFPLFRSDVNSMAGWIKFVFLTGDLIRAADIDPPSTVKPQLLFFESHTEDYPVQLFCTAGNHDIVGIMNVEWDPNDADYGYRWYIRDVGPLRYSFNYAGIHFVGIDWMTRMPSDSWYANVSEIAVDWLTEDLDLLPQGTRIFLFMHYPVTISNVVQSYGVEHIFAGHTHSVSSFTYSGVPVTLAGSISQTCSAGECEYPLGYDIVHVTESGVSTDYYPLGSPPPGNPYIQDFEDDFDSYVAGAGLPWPWSLSDTNNMVVNASGWQGSQGVFASSTNWCGSSRPTNYDPSETCYEISLKAKISSVNSSARHTWKVGNSVGSLFFEMNENTLSIAFPGGSVPFVGDVWYDISIALCKDAGNIWSWHGLYRAWTGSAWAGWITMGSGNLLEGFEPETVKIGGIYAFDVSDPGNSAMDDIAFRVVVEPFSCYTAIAAGFGQAADLNKDCYVNLKDFALIAQDWLRCMNPTDPACQ